MGIGLAIFFWYLSSFDASQWKLIREGIANANFGWVMLSMLIGLASHILRAHRWKYLLEPVVNTPVRLINLILSVGISYLVNLGIPRSGEIARAGVLSQYEDVEFSKALGTVFTERIIDLFMLGLFILLGLSLEFHFIRNMLSPLFSGHNGNHIWKLIFIPLFLLVFFIWLFLSESKTAQKIKDFLRGLLTGILSVIKIKHKSVFIAETVFIWLGYLLMLYVVMFAFNETANLGPGAIILVFIVGSLSIVISNGGIGTYPVFVTEALALYGIPRETGFAFSLVMWTSQTLLVIIFGLFSFLLLPIVNGKNQSSSKFP